MAIKTKGLSRNSASRYTSSPDINVTPFVDILLVLLVIFMVTTPAIVSGLNINLPKGDANHNVQIEDTNITVTMDSGKLLYVNDKPVAGDSLVQEISIAAKGDQKAVIFLRADATLQYQDVMQAINKLASNGFGNIVLVTENDK